MLASLALQFVIVYVLAAIVIVALSVQRAQAARRHALAAVDRHEHDAVVGNEDARPTWPAPAPEWDDPLFGPPRPQRPEALVALSFGTPLQRTRVFCNVRGVPCEAAAACQRRGCLLVGNG